ncbi:MAG: universal stress protein [Rhodospirillales bacterium]|nr:universal stress protein [Rhodospirillales bacterium]
MAAAQRDTTTKAERAKQTFEAWRKTADLPLIERPGGAVGPSVAWVEETGAEDERVARRGRVADLIVAAQPTSSGAIASTVTFEAALLDTGRPVIVAPPAAGTGIGGGAAVVAWNGSAESARAVSFSLPFLALSTRVVVVAAKEGATAADADPLISYLAWHGVRADTVTPEVHTAAVGPHLLEEAQKIGAGMLVMGAYTHNRLRQMVFGGVTRHVLGHAKLPVLMAH